MDKMVQNNIKIRANENKQVKAMGDWDNGSQANNENQRWDNQIKREFRGLGYTTTITCNAQLMD
jgi:hypothetical protein